MQPKKQLKVQYIGIFEEIDSFYWPKVHFLKKKGQKSRAWVDPPPLPNFLQTQWIFTSEKKGPSCPKWGQGGGGG